MCAFWRSADWGYLQLLLIWGASVPHTQHCFDSEIVCSHIPDLLSDLELLCPVYDQRYPTRIQFEQPRTQVPALTTEPTVHAAVVTSDGDWCWARSTLRRDRSGRGNPWKGKGGGGEGETRVLRNAGVSVHTHVLTNIAACWPHHPGSPQTAHVLHAVGIFSEIYHYEI